MNSQSNATNEFLWSRFEKFSDERTKGWPLVDSPLDVAVILILYLSLVRWGPKIMESKKPFKMKGFLMAYNFFQVGLNSLIVKDIFLGSSRRGYGYWCHRSPTDFHPEEMRVVRGLWLFYISKAVDLLDTLFFVLRKKNDQLSLLHVYHHSTMLPIMWTSVKWYPSGASSRLAMLNSFVHVAMYTYYGLSAMGPRVQKFLWWKKYLTQLQLVQFVVSLTWGVNSLVKGCNHHPWVDLLNIFYMCSFLYLFGRFYLTSYKKKLK